MAVEEGRNAKQGARSELQVEGEREEGRGEVETETEIRESRGKGGFELEELSFRYTEDASSGEKRAFPKKREKREERV